MLWEANNASRIVTALLASTCARLVNTALAALAWLAMDNVRVNLAGSARSAMSKVTSPPSLHRGSIFADLEVVVLAAVALPPPLPPTAVIHGYSSIGFCDGLTLDGSQSFGLGAAATRVYSWSLQGLLVFGFKSSIVDVVLVASFAGYGALGVTRCTLSLGGSQLTCLPAELPANATYIFSLTVSNSGQNLTSPAALFTVTKSLQALPLVAVVAPTRVNRPVTNTFSLTLVPSTCAGQPSGSYSFSWSIQPAVAGLALTQHDLFVPANTLRVS